MARRLLASASWKTCQSPASITGPSVSSSSSPSCLKSRTASGSSRLANERTGAKTRRVVTLCSSGSTTGCASRFPPTVPTPFVVSSSGRAQQEPSSIRLNEKLQRLAEVFVLPLQVDLQGRPVPSRGRTGLFHFSLLLPDRGARHSTPIDSHIVLPEQLATSANFTSASATGVSSSYVS